MRVIDYGLWDSVDSPLSDAAKAAVRGAYVMCLAQALDIDADDIETHDEPGTSWHDPDLGDIAGVIQRAWDEAWQMVVIDDDGNLA